MSASSTFKDLLLRKLYHSVVCSVLSQLVILQLYVFALNFDATHPIEWFLATFRVFASLNTWILTLSFVAIVFAQSVICAKDYVFRTSYCSTRFRKLLSVFSLHNFLILVLNVTAGVTLTWLLLHLGGGDSLLKECHNGRYCLDRDVFYVLMGGLWNGFYYFSKVHVAQKHLDFPVVHQRKLLQFKAQVIPLLKESSWMFITPMLYYMVIFFLRGDKLFNSLTHFFGLEEENTAHTTLSAYIHLYIFGTIYCFNMNLMRFFFNLFLTEPMEFSLVKQKEDTPCLQTSINMSELPIIQHLACMDLYNLAQWSKPRRQVFFSLSHLGGHPYNWNSLVESVLKLFATQIEMLGKPTETKTPSEPIPQIQSPYNKFHNLRNMSLVQDDGVADIVEMNYTSPPILSAPKLVFDKLVEKLSSILSMVKVLLGINYFFGELPQANIQKFLSDGYIIIWSSQGISSIICASLKEDQYGIVQKDLPAIITSLVQLKQQLDKLNKVPALTRRIIGGEDFYFRMMGAISAAVRRSLFNICRCFEKYLHEIPLSHEVLQQLQSIYKN